MTASSVLAALFWIGVSGTLYAYILFPAVAFLASARKRTQTCVRTDDRAPSTIATVIVPAFNEERSIEQKIANVLASNYPSDLLDVIVVSDASTDRTNEIAAGFSTRGVRLLVQEMRRGKTAGLNRAIAIATGEIVIFTDANALFTPDTIRTLIAYFTNPSVGLVTGYTRYTISTTGEIAEATNVYTSLERLIKRSESAWGYCVGADGAIFAMRRSLYSTLRDDDINDFVLPLGVIDHGYKCVFADDAYCFENAGNSLESEFRRQSRITSRTLRALWRKRRLLNPLRSAGFAFFLVSHKVVRLLVPILLALSAVSLALLAGRGGAYLTVTAATIVVISLAAIAFATARRMPFSRLIHFVRMFLTVNLAMLQGWWKFITGRVDVTWQHDRTRRTAA